MLKKNKFKNLILLFLLIIGNNSNSQNFLSKKGMWEFNSGADINLPKESGYNYTEHFSNTDCPYFIDVNIEPKTVVTPYINFGRNELLFNKNDRHIMRLGYGITYYKKKYQLLYSGIDAARNGIIASTPSPLDSVIHNGIETYSMKNFGINLSFLYFYKTSKYICLYNKIEINFANPYSYNRSYSDTSIMLNGSVHIYSDEVKQKRIKTNIKFPFPTLTLNYYSGVSFSLTDAFTITPNMGIQFLRRDFDRNRELFYWDQDLFNKGTYQINKHYLFVRAGISLSFNFS